MIVHSASWTYTESFLEFVLIVIVAVHRKHFDHFTILFENDVQGLEPALRVTSDAAASELAITIGRFLRGFAGIFRSIFRTGRIRMVFFLWGLGLELNGR